MVMGQMVVHVFDRSEKSREQWLRDHHGRGWESKRGLVRWFDLLLVSGKLCPAVERLVADHTGQRKPCLSIEARGECVRLEETAMDDSLPPSANDTPSSRR